MDMLKIIVLEQMSSISREIEILRKDQNEILQTKNTLTEMKSAFYGFNSRLESIYELQDISVKFLNTTKQREKRPKTNNNKINIQGLWANGVT